MNTISRASIDFFDSNNFSAHSKFSNMKLDSKQETLKTSVFEIAFVSTTIWFFQFVAFLNFLCASHVYALHRVVYASIFIISTIANVALHLIHHVNEDQLDYLDDEWRPFDSLKMCPCPINISLISGFL